MYALGMGYVRTMCGLCVDYYEMNDVWIRYGLCKNCVWIVYGLSLEYVWVMYGSCMD